MNALAAGPLRAANPLFDRDWYLAMNPDVAAVGADPWEHYLRHGAAEGRDPNPLFDGDWYLSQYPRVQAARMNPLLHYWHWGAAQGYDPNPLFDSDWYLARNPDVHGAGFNPLLHYLQHGAAEGRDPCAQFDSEWYLRSNSDLRPGKLTALGDYLRYGHLEGRSHTRPRDGGHGARAQRVNGVAHDCAVENSADRERIAVYTAIIGDYDCLKIPTEVDPDCDYYCFTDRDISWQSVWTRRNISMRHPDPVRMARHIKHNPQVYFADYP